MDNYTDHCKNGKKCRSCGNANCILADIEEPKIGEECGVIGMYDLDGNDVASSIYYGTLCFATQRTGELWYCCQPDEMDRSVIPAHVKAWDWLMKYLIQKRFRNFQGDIGVGHVRYSTAGASVAENTQPLVLNYIKGSLLLAHNGNLVNALELRNELELNGAIFQTTIDSEVIAYLIARERLKVGKVEEAVKNAMKRLKGAYSLVVASPRKLIGARDPFGFRPLCIGKRENAYILASESCALDTIGAEFIRDVEPGEIVTITQDGIRSDKSMTGSKKARCIFEYIYFARPDSYIDGICVHSSRITAGRILAQTHPADADIVVGVPESGNAAAMGFSLESGIPYGTAFVKNSYVGRTFIKPKQSARESSVMVKLNALREVVKGKRVVMVDDLIVVVQPVQGLLRC